MKIFLILLILYSHSQAFFLLLIPIFGSNSNSKPKIEYYSLKFDLGKHQDAKIVIKNIKEPYKSGMLLKKGNYDIQITRPGYESITNTINLKQNAEYKVLFTLDTEYFRSACIKGDSESCFNLALAYDNGLDRIKQNFEEAAKYYEMGCNLNEAYSCLGFAVLTYYGQGVYQNTSKAKEYLQKSCNLRNANACEYLDKLNKGL